VTIFDGRGASAAGTTLYYISSYQESYRLHTKHAFIYATRTRTEKRIKREYKRKRKRTITRRRFMRENRYIYRYTPTSKADALPGVWHQIQRKESSIRTSEN